MYCKGTLFILCVIQELLNNVVRGSGTIKEIEVKMLDAVLGKLLLVILWFIEPDDHCHAHFFENGDIVLRCKRSVLISHVQWS